MLKANADRSSLLTDEVDDKAAVARPAGGVAKESPPVRRRAVGAGVLCGQADIVAGVGERVAEAEDARVATESRAGGVPKAQQSTRHSKRQGEMASQEPHGSSTRTPLCICR